MHISRESNHNFTQALELKLKVGFLLCQKMTVEVYLVFLVVHVHRKASLYLLNNIKISVKMQRHPLLLKIHNIISNKCKLLILVIMHIQSSMGAENTPNYIQDCTVSTSAFQPHINT